MVHQAPSAGSEDSQFAHFGGHARPHSGPMDTFKVTTKESPLRPGAATKFKYDSHVSLLSKYTLEPIYSKIFANTTISFELV